MSGVRIILFLLGYVANTLADSCAGRCGQAFNNTENTFNCQCDAACSTYQDCCYDYSDICVKGGGDGSGHSTDTLSSVMDDIWDSDTNRFTSSEIVVNTTGSRLFTNVDETKFALPTFRAFINLLDNYDPTIGEEEVLLGTSTQEIETFLDAVLATNALNLTRAYLISKGKVSSCREAFRDILKGLWFTLSPRLSSQTFDDSSGNEHALIGELKSQTVVGLQSWIQFYHEEKAGTLTYMSMAYEAEPNIKGVAFRWHGVTKSKGSFFMGTSPEFDMAVYSICALVYQNARCDFTLKGNRVCIQTWDIEHKPGSRIGSAYLAV